MKSSARMIGRNLILPDLFIVHVSLMHVIAYSQRIRPRLILTDDGDIQWCYTQIICPFNFPFPQFFFQYL